MNIINIFSKLLYWPLCRAYARRLGDKPGDALFRSLCSLQFRRIHGFWPNFQFPQYFTEKMWSRMIYDRNPQFTIFCDKLRVRDFVSVKIGPQYLVPMLWSGTDPGSIPFDTLPARFVIKANHGCAFNILVPDKRKLDVPAAIRQLRNWLQINFCTDTYLGIAWGYKNIPPCIVIEEYIEEKGGPPVDYKMYCFGKYVEFMTVHYDRFQEHKTRSFDRRFQPYNFRYDFDQWSGHCERPENLDEMVDVAETLAEGCDFVRVDLYHVGQKVYFGELTPYPGGVSTKFLPRSTDFNMGQRWE